MRVCIRKQPEMYMLCAWKVSDFSWFPRNLSDLVITHDGFHRLSLFGGSNVVLYGNLFTFNEKEIKVTATRKTQDK